VEPREYIQNRGGDAQQQPPCAACCGWFGRMVEPFSEAPAAAPDGSCESINRVLMSLWSSG
jgi:hypothetical protein